MSLESALVAKAVLDYLSSMKCQKTRNRVIQAIDLVHHSKLRQLKPTEIAGISRVQKHLKRINSIAERAIAEARKHQN